MSNIRGYSQASAVLGVEVRVLRTAISRAKEKGMLPPKSKEGKGRGGMAYTWKDEEALRAWHRALSAAPPYVASSTDPVAAPPLGEAPIVGVRSASAALGVTNAVLEKTIKKLKAQDSFLPFHPAMKKWRGGKAYTWASEKQLAEWWDRAREALGTTYPVPPRRPQGIVHPPADPGFYWNGRGEHRPASERGPGEEGSLLIEVIGQDYYEALKCTRDLLDTPSVRIYRELKNEPLPQMPLSEVLQLVIARGLAALEEEL